MNLILGVAPSSYKDLGCYIASTDDGNIQIIGSLEGKHSILDAVPKFRVDPVDKCYQAACHFGYTVFALQNGGFCHSDVGAYAFYDYFGKSSYGCDEAGGWKINRVYQINTEIGMMNRK